MGDVAFCAILSERHKKGKWWTLGLAEKDVPGYYEVKETGDPSDPLYVAPYDTRFSTRVEAELKATELNLFYFKITENEAFDIVISSIRAQNMQEIEEIEEFVEQVEYEDYLADDKQNEVESPIHDDNPKRKLPNKNNM